LYGEAHGIFAALGEWNHAGVVALALEDIERELEELPLRGAQGNGDARIHV
jgi:hypothetical protein